MGILEKKLTKEDFINLIELSKGTIDFFDPKKNYIMHNNYVLYLSNGDKIKFNFNPNNIPHLLGFKDLSVLIGEKVDSYNAVKKIAFSNTARNKAIEKIEENNWKYESFMSKHYISKLKYIKNQTTAPYPNEVLFVCKYNTELNYGKDCLDKYKDCDYYIGRKQQNGDILVLGLSKNKYGTYSPRTNRLFEKDEADEKLKELLENQVICFANGLAIVSTANEFNHKPFLNDDEKIDALQNLMSLSRKTSSTIDCSENFLYDIRNRAIEKIARSVLQQTISNISSSVEKGELIELEEKVFESFNFCEEEVKELIQTINDRLCVVSKNDSTKVKYSKLLKENEKKEIENKRLLRQLEEEKEKLSSLKAEFNNLKRENVELSKSNKKMEKKLILLNNENEEDE